MASRVQASVAGALARDDEIERVRTFARVLDHYGVDAVLGFVLPGVGDVVGSLLGLYIVGIAVRRGVSPVVIVRMLLNLGIDLVIGVVPMLGDLADFAFRANDRNLRLLEARPERRARASDWALVGAVGVGFAAVVALVAWAVVAAIRWLG